MRIAVTGARGFIGHRVVEALIGLGVETTSLERPQRLAGTSSRPPDSARAVGPNRRGIDFGAKSSNVHSDCGSPDVLIHLAWGGVADIGSNRHLRDELPLHTAFLSGALESGTPHVIVTGSCFEYGPAEGVLSEQTPVRPMSPYAHAKVRLHATIAPVAVTAGVRLTWLRPFYVFGEGQPSTTLWGQLHAAIARGDAEFPMSGGEQTRDYLPVTEMGRLIAEIAVRAPGNAPILNVCSGRSIRIRDLVDSWIEASGSPIRPVRGVLPYSAIEPMHAYGSRSLLDHLLLGPCGTTGTQIYSSTD